jgi:hypothetical protein
MYTMMTGIIAITDAAIRILYSFPPSLNKYLSPIGKVLIFVELITIKGHKY